MFIRIALNATEQKKNYNFLLVRCVQVIRLRANKNDIRYYTTTLGLQKVFYSIFVVR